MFDEKRLILSGGCWALPELINLYTAAYFC
jgi:hypothetical protein